MKLPKAYEPNQYEKDIYDLWEKAKAFEPRRQGSKDNFAMVLPLPNANGDLHVGHALMFGLQDIVTRYQRMKGQATLWLPGTDHAGFETQVVYEKELAKEGKSRFDFSREELYKRIWDFVESNKQKYEQQFRRLGASVDWSRYTYSLDSKIIKQAYATFKKMWDEGLIYRGERLVNFCTFHGTAFADIEVEYKEVKGKLWHIRYPLTDGTGEIVVATTRPETMFGDTAVAVQPKDPRYKSLIGKSVKLPLTKREIPIIGDELVDKTFGTGAVKITPAHDPNDFEAAQRHDLPLVSVIDHEGKLTHEVPVAFRGRPALEAREAVVKALADQKFLVKTEDYSHSVGHCYKCGTVIQPLLREQWFVDMKPLAKRAIEVLKANKIKFYPSAKKDQLIRYLEGLKDWNISRQIAWGIPIPAFQSVDNPDEWIYDERVGEETIDIKGKTYRRDPDVFDTWFSSSSWPYATLDYPDGEDFKQFYPNNLMETGGEILYPWVSRMIMLGLYVTGEIPFKEVYIHGYVLAEDNTKMSKSVGNVIDPMQAIDQYGSDALRMGLITGRAAAINRPYDKTKTIAGRNFANKLWNTARFIEGKLNLPADLSSGAVAKEEATVKAREDFKPGAPEPKTAADHWILTKLQQSTEGMTSHLDNYRFAEAYDVLYRLVWDEFADWYIEASKANPNPSLLAYVLEQILKLAHPFAPFVTETIWQTLAWEKGLLIMSDWPDAKAGDKGQTEDFEEVRSIVSEIRYIKSVLHVQGLSLYYKDSPFLSDNAKLIARLAGLEGVNQVSSGQGLNLLQTRHHCWLDVDRQSVQHYADKLATKKQQQAKIIAQLKHRLDNKAYVKQAPSSLVEESKQQLKAAEELLTNLTQEYNRFQQG